jgi:phospholipid/cholesterol/gamma-HCH transport system substrate-binding protein
MTTAIRKHLRDFIALALLVVLAIVVGWIVVQQERLRVPVLEQKPFTLKAELSTAQSVTPGQGQTVRVAGVRIGDISKVELKNGVAVVTMAIDRKYLPIYRDATILLRPKTGLKDMFLELDPGSRAAGEFSEGDTIPVANTLPDVNLDEILELLDSDTQAYLRLLLVGAGEGLKGQGRNLGHLLGSLGPINRQVARLNGEVATRRHNLAHLIHNLRVLTGAVGTKNREIAQLVDASNAVFQAIGSQDPQVQRAVAELPGTLSVTHTTLGKVNRLALVLGPTFNDLRPFARNLDEMNASVRRLANATTPIIRDQIRPFVRAARKPVSDLAAAAGPLARATPQLTTIAKKINRLGNMVAYNPRGAEPPPATLPGTPPRDEGYLYWLAYLSHNANSVFQSQDGAGLYRRIYFTESCASVAGLLKQTGPLGALVTGQNQLFGVGRPCGP